MTKRNIIKIDEKKCNGCGLCIPNCPEGALKVIDGKARLVSDLFCDGLGACIGHCPQGAIKIEKRNAEPYNETKVMTNIIKQGSNTIKAHLEHLQDHDEKKYLKEAIYFLRKKNIANPLLKEEHPKQTYCSCPGSQMHDFTEQKDEDTSSVEVKSQLRQWPVQLHLVSPQAPYFNKRDVLIAADCTAFSFGNFHHEFLKGKSLAIACPKLDSNQEIYEEKIKSLIEDSEIKSLTIVVMEVPCCRGLVHIAESAADSSKRKVPIKVVTIGIDGSIKEHEKLR